MTTITAIVVTARALLSRGTPAGPLQTVVSLIQELSLNPGDTGWAQVVQVVLAGLLSVVTR